MWQFAEVVDGMSEACEALGIPVIGGNVSFYNESRGADIHPTPVVGVLGLIDELTDVPPGRGTARRATRSSCSGDTTAELGGSEWAAVVHGLDGGRPPVADLDARGVLHEFVASSSSSATVTGVHDVSDGGLAVALAEMAFGGERRLPRRRSEPERLPPPRGASPSRRRGSSSSVDAARVADGARAGRGRGRARRRPRGRPAATASSPTARSTWRSPTPSAPGATRSRPRSASGVT